MNSELQTLRVRMVLARSLLELQNRRELSNSSISAG
jgi:hypothetical protein